MFLWCLIEFNLDWMELWPLKESSIQPSLDEGICVNYFRHQTIKGFISYVSK